MGRVLKWCGWTLASLVVVALAVYVSAYWVATSRYNREWTVHAVDFPIPFPLTDEQVAALKAERIAGGVSEKDPLAGVDRKAIALDRAIGRGRHLVESRVGCKPAMARIWVATPSSTRRSSVDGLRRT